MIHKKITFLVTMLIMVITQTTFTMEPDEDITYEKIGFADHYWNKNNKNNKDKYYQLNKKGLLKGEVSNRCFHEIYINPQEDKYEDFCKKIMEYIEKYPLLQHAIAHVEICKEKKLPIKIIAQTRYEAQTVINCFAGKFKESDVCLENLKTTITLYQQGLWGCERNFEQCISIFDLFGVLEFNEHGIPAEKNKLNKGSRVSNQIFFTNDESIRTMQFSAELTRKVYSDFPLLITRGESLESIKFANTMREKILLQVKRRGYWNWLLACASTGVAGFIGSYVLWKNENQHNKYLAVAAGISAFLMTLVCGKAAKDDYATLRYKKLIDNHLNEWHQKWIPGTDGKNHYEEIVGDV